jgi:small subunit ribosomal protein S6
VAGGRLLSLRRSGYLAKLIVIYIFSATICKSFCSTPRSQQPQKCSGAIDQREVKPLNNYELLFIADPTLTEEKHVALLERVRTQIESAGGAVESVDDWGRRRFAYPIGRLDEGHYLLYNFKSVGRQANALDMQLRLLPGMVRFIIVRKEQ